MASLNLLVNKRKSTVSFEINQLVDVVNSELLKRRVCVKDA